MPLLLTPGFQWQSLQWFQNKVGLLILSYQLARKSRRTQTGGPMKSNNDLTTIESMAISTLLYQTAPYSRIPI